MKSFSAFCAALLRALLLAVLLAGCGKGPQILPLVNDDIVLAFGDSLTFGTGASAAESYPAQLQTLIGRKVVNAGVPGEISGDGLRRLPGVLDEIQPRLLILCHGGNDFLQKQSETAAAANVRAMIKLAKDKGIDVVLIATPKPGLSISPPAFYAALAKEFAIPFNAYVDVAYVGQHSWGFPQAANINAIDFGAAFLPTTQDPTQTSTVPGAASIAALNPDLARFYRGHGVL